MDSQAEAQQTQSALKDVPHEIVDIILRMLDEQLEFPVCRFVCKQWWKMLPAPSAPSAAWQKALCARIAGKGYLSLLQWITEQGCLWDAQTCAAAAAGGHTAVLQWATEHGCPWDATTCAGAAGGGHLSTLMWARLCG